MTKQRAALFVLLAAAAGFLVASIGHLSSPEAVPGRMILRFLSMGGLAALACASARPWIAAPLAGLGVLAIDYARIIFPSFPFFDPLFMAIFLRENAHAACLAASTAGLHAVLQRKAVRRGQAPGGAWAGAYVLTASAIHLVSQGLQGFTYGPGYGDSPWANAWIWIVGGQKELGTVYIAFGAAQFAALRCSIGRESGRPKAA